MQRLKSSLFVVGSNTTKYGLVNQLFEKRPKFLLVDELEKMNNADQVSLLHLMETGIISEAKINKTRQIELTSRVFATANSCQKIIEPLLSRFVVLEIPKYTFDEFREIAVTKLVKENIDRHLAQIIIEKVWSHSRDIRDVIKVGRLVRNEQEVSLIITMMKRNKPAK